jgi:hypothetical protein
MEDAGDTPGLADQTELFIALVAAVGTDVGMVGEEVGVELAEYGYAVHPLRLSEYLAEEAGEDFRDKKLDEQLWDAMTAGDELRASWNRSDALALHAISDIVATREELSPPLEEDEQPGYLDRHAFVLRSLKTPDELETLRAICTARRFRATTARVISSAHFAEHVGEAEESVREDGEATGSP